jgi:hypothetical protein
MRLCRGRYASPTEKNQRIGIDSRRTELLLDDLENFLLVEFLRKTLNSRQSLTPITLCEFEY